MEQRLSVGDDRCISVFLSLFFPSLEPATEMRGRLVPVVLPFGRRSPFMLAVARRTSPGAGQSVLVRDILDEMKLFPYDVFKVVVQCFDDADSVEELGDEDVIPRNRRLIILQKGQAGCQISVNVRLFPDDSIVKILSRNTATIRELAERFDHSLTAAFLGNHQISFERTLLDVGYCPTDVIELFTDGELDRAGAEGRLMFDVWWSRTYFPISRPGYIPGTEIRCSGRFIDTDDGRLLKIKKEVIVELQDRGFVVLLELSGDVTFEALGGWVRENKNVGSCDWTFWVHGTQRDAEECVTDYLGDEIVMRLGPDRPQHHLLDPEGDRFPVQDANLISESRDEEGSSAE
jgi:hypothetical protein